MTDRMTVTREFCYHRRRHASQEFCGTQAWNKIRCLDCGAEVSASHGVPLPPLEPMPRAASASEREK